MQEICSINGKTMIVNLKGDLDHHVTEQIRTEIDEKALMHKVNRIVFDFKNVGFMDSSGIGLLMGRYRKISESGGEVYVANVGYAMQRIFRMSGLYKILKQTGNINYKEAVHEQI